MTEQQLSANTADGDGPTRTRCAPATTGGRGWREVLAAPPRDAHDPLALALVREQLRLLARESEMNSLSERERRAVVSVAGGASRSDVVVRIGGMEKAVDNALQRGRRKLAATLAA